MSGKKPYMEEKRDWIDYIIDEVYKYYDKREVVLWGKYETADEIAERMKKRYGIKTAFHVESDAAKIDDIHVRPKQCLKGRADQYYVIVPLAFYQSLKDDLVSWGYRKDLDYFYFSDCIVQNTADYYEDLHGNRIIGKHRNVKFYFTGFNSTIKFGQDVLLNDCIIYMNNDSQIEIGDKTEIEKSVLSIGNGASFFVGCNGKLPGGLIGVYENASLKIGNNFSIGSGYVWSVCECTECVIGEDCMFSYDIYFFTNDAHTIFDIKTGENINSTYKISQKRKIIIGNHVWIGMRVNILGNAEIGDGSIIGASSLAKGKIPNNCIAAGTPAKVVRTDVAWSRKNMAENIVECGEEYIRLTDNEERKSNE